MSFSYQPLSSASPRSDCRRRWAAIVDKDFGIAQQGLRHEMLHQLLTKCTSTDLLFIQNYLSGLKKSNRWSSDRLDFISELPEELAVLILKFVGCNNSNDGHSQRRSLAKLCLVSRKWNRIIQDNDLWRQICLAHGWLPSVNETVNSSNNKQELVHHRRSSSPSPLSPPSLLSWSMQQPSLAKLRTPWKRVFIENYLTRVNWESGKFQVRPVLESGSNSSRRRSPAAVQGVADNSGNNNNDNNSNADESLLRNSLCLSVDDQLSEAVSVSPSAVPGGLQVWELQTRRRKSTFLGHQGLVSAVKFNNGRIASGGVDCQLRLWDAQTGECLKVLNGHQGEIECIHFTGGTDDDDLLVSGSQDRTVRVWSMKSNHQTGDIQDCLAVLEGHEDSVTCVHFDRYRIASGSCDATVRLWSRNTHECLHVLNGHTAHIYCLQISEQYVVSGANDDTARIWDAKSGRCLRTLQGHRGGVSCLQFDEHKLITGSGDQTIKVWSMPQGRMLYTMHQHAGVVWNLRFDKSRMVSTSLDQSVLLWDFNGLCGVSSADRQKWGIDNDNDNDDNDDDDDDNDMDMN